MAVVVVHSFSLLCSSPNCAQQTWLALRRRPHLPCRRRSWPTRQRRLSLIPIQVETFLLYRSTRFCPMKITHAIGLNIHQSLNNKLGNITDVAICFILFFLYHLLKCVASLHNTFYLFPLYSQWYGSGEGESDFRAMPCFRPRHFRGILSTLRLP